MQQYSNGQILYAPSDLVTFLGCRHASFLDVKALREDIDKAETSTINQLLQKKGAEHEAAYLQRLKDEGKTVIEISNRAPLTLEVMQSGADIIYQAVFFAPPWRGRADFLITRFGGATLTKANFQFATLTGADFEGANITGASLTDAHLSGVILLVHREFMKEYKSNPVRGTTREQLEEGWIHKEGRLPMKIEEYTYVGEDGPEYTTQTAMTLTEANWKELGLDSQPNFSRDPPPPP